MASRLSSSFLPLVFLAFLVVATEIAVALDCSTQEQAQCTLDNGCMWRGQPAGCVKSPGTLRQECYLINLDNCGAPTSPDCAPGFLIGHSKEQCVPTEKMLLPLCRQFNEAVCEHTMHFGACLWTDGLCRYTVETSGGSCSEQPTESACLASPKVCQWLGRKCAPGQQAGMAKCCGVAKPFCKGKRRGNKTVFKRVWKACKNISGLQKRPASVCHLVADPANCS